MLTPTLIEQFKTLETPFYFYDRELLQNTLERLKKATPKGYHVHYALKANANAGILEMILRAGLGADCVSGNEVKRALDAGFNSSQIVFAGVGKTDKEIQI